MWGNFVPFIMQGNTDTLFVLVSYAHSVHFHLIKRHCISLFFFCFVSFKYFTVWLHIGHTWQFMKAQHLKLSAEVAACEGLS